MQNKGGEEQLNALSDPRRGAPPPQPSTSERQKPLDACVICLEPITERAVAVPCNHCSFDFLCLASWLQERSKCPLCNTELSAVQYDWRTPDDYKTYNLSSSSTSSAPSNNTTAVRQPHNRRRRPHHSHHQQPASAAAAISRRRYVYRHNLYSLHVGANRISAFRDITPRLFARSPELQARARTWIRRELAVFDFLSADGPAPAPGPASAQQQQQQQRGRGAENAEFLLSYITAILRTVDVRAASGRAQALLAEFLGPAHATLFWHELGTWLRSPYAALDAWDRHVQYKVPLSDFDGALGCGGDGDGDESGAANGGAGAVGWRGRAPRWRGAASICDARDGDATVDAAEARRRYSPD